MAILGANADYSYLLKGGCMAYASPLVISASINKNLDKEMVGGAKSCETNGNYTAEVKDIAELKAEVTKLFDNLASDNQSGDDINRASKNLNDKVDAKSIIDAVFDKGTFIELNKAFAPQVKTGIGFIGDSSVASIIFDAEGGVELTSCVMQKLNDFVKFANRNNYTVVTFVNTLGIKQDAKTNSSSIALKAGNAYVACNEDATAISSTVVEKVITPSDESAVEAGTLYELTGTDNVYLLYGSGKGITLTYTIDATNVEGGIEVSLVSPNAGFGRGTRVLAFSVEEAE
jgi:acetyl-CoA/propionyl-CoA carboxylase